MGRLIGLLATTIAVGAGLITLIGLLTNFAPGQRIADIFLRLVVVSVALTIILGVLNLLSVHFGRIIGTKRGWFYSLVLLLSFLLVIGLTVAERANLIHTPPGQAPASMILLDTVQVSVESALAGLLVFALVYGAYRLMRRRVTLGGTLFTVVLLIVLIGALPIPLLRPLAQARDWLLAVPVSAGARGILLGIALATVVTGVRILIGQDRSYRE